MKLKYILTLATFLTAGSAVSYAASTCVNGGTLATYVGLGSTGCEIGDKIFSSFSYSPTGTDPTSGSVEVGIDDNTGLNQFGVQLQTSGNVWTSSFTLDYTITIDQTACAALYGAGYTCTMTGAQGAFQGGLAPNNAALTMVLGSSGTLNLNDLTTNANTQQINPFTGVTSMNVAMTASGELGTADPIDTFGLDVYQTATSAVPEPATLGMVGGALLGLGALRRRRGSRQKS